MALGIIFVGMASIVLAMVYGKAPATESSVVPKESLASIIPPAVLCAGVVVLGVYIPPALNQLLADAAQLLGGR